MSTPAVSAVIRKKKASSSLFFFISLITSAFKPFSYIYLSVALMGQSYSQADGGFIMSASHNPGGPEYDWGIKVCE